MNDVLNYLFEFSLCITVSWLFYKLFLEKLTFFEWNRTYLMSTFLLSVVLPLMSFELNSDSEIIREMVLPEVWVGQNLIDNSAGFWETLGWQEILLVVYLVGAFIMLGRLIYGLSKSFYFLKIAKKIRNGNLSFAVHPDFQPASFFKYIFLPDYRPDDPDQQQIVLHESIHVERLHTYDLLLVQFGKVLLWFNPLIYIFEESLREVHEFEADQAVTKSYSSFDYSRLLVRLISGNKRFQCIHYFSQFQTKKRILMMNKVKSAKSQKSRFLLFIPVFALLILAFACEKPSSQETPPVIMENPDKEAMPDQDGLYKNLPITESAPDDVFDVVEESPMPYGGMEGWINYLTTNLEYPKQARTEGIEGMVLINFIVNEDGSISDAVVERGIGAGCDAEALRVVNEAPSWQPGKQKGKAVKVRMRLPINFKLGSDDGTISSNKLFQHRFAGLELTPQGIKTTKASIIPMDPSKGC